MEPGYELFCFLFPRNPVGKTNSQYRNWRKAMKRIGKFVLLTSSALLLSVGSVSAQHLRSSSAEQDSNYAISSRLPGGSEVTVYTGAPAGFDPDTAADEDLQAYGYPRRPEPNDKKAYTMWQRAVGTTRITAQLVPNPGRFHRPNQQLATLATVKNTTNSLSGNWSGYSLVGGSPVFDQVVGTWIVPNIGSEFEKFTGYSSMWVGIDGNCSCNDLIQDGTEQEWVNGLAKYSAWIEFIPESEVVIKNFPVAPGDVIYATSWVGTKNGAITGFYYMANYNTNLSVSASIAMPAGDTFSGQSAEWIVERTEVNGSFSNPLPYYAYAYMDDAWAYRAGSTTRITYLSEANQNITMVNGSDHLSEAYEQDSDSMWFKWLAYQ
jgi:hypothetical protein